MTERCWLSYITQQQKIIFWIWVLGIYFKTTIQGSLRVLARYDAKTSENRPLVRFPQ